jgi:hypothetical protein
MRHVLPLVWEEDNVISRNDLRGPMSRRRKGMETTARKCLKCGEWAEMEGQYHICQPCTWANQRLERIYGSEGVKAPSWWH